MKKVILFSLMGIFLFSFVAAQMPGQGMQGQGTEFILEDIEIGVLDGAEADGLFLMREEEKLARDVYLALYEKHNLPIFSNIAASEQTHMNAVLVLIERYGLEDSALNEQGVFNNAKLQDLYITLVTQGEGSLVEGLNVGAIIEDLDIYDLNKLISETDKEDLIMVYGNLVKGSRNHLRSFVLQMENNGGTYSAQYIDSSLLDEILGSPKETGSILNEDSSVISSFNSRLKINQGDEIMPGPRVMARAGNYTNQEGRQIMIHQQENNQCRLESEGVLADCPFNLTQEQFQNRTRLYAALSNGRNAEIKVMPDNASQIALQRLRLKNCVEEEGCMIELRETGIGNQTRLAYELRTQRPSKVFGLFNANMQVQVQVDAETGELIQTKKPWWAFLASEPEEE